MGMTRSQLERSLQPGEIAEYIAYDQLEADARSKAAERARKAAEVTQNGRLR